MVKKTVKTKKTPATKKKAVKPVPAKKVISPVKAKKELPTLATKKVKKAEFSWDIRTWKLAPLATLGRIGYFPKGSGTMGALVALPIVYLLSYLSVSILWLTVVILFMLGLIAVDQFTKNKTEKDPSCVIIDEVVGQMIPFMVVLPEFMHWPTLLAGFILFRFFDICKFGPVAFWDRRKDPMGVMMDDVTAGICAGFIMAMMQVIIVEFFGA